MAVQTPQAVNIPSGSPTAEVQNLTVSATGGTFTVSYGGYTTTPLAYNISAADLETALDALGSIANNDVEVTGGVGDETGSAPYVLTWLAALDDVDQPTTNDALLTGGAGTAEVETVTPGVADDVISTEAGTLYGFSFQEAAAGTAKVILRDGTDSSGIPIAFISLAANGSVVQSLATPLRYMDGLYLDRVSGTTVGSAWIVE